MQIINKKKRTAMAGLFAASILMNGCSSSAENKDPEKTAVPESKGLAVFPLQRGKISSNIQVPGELIAYQQVDIYAKVTSFVKQLSVDVGSEVKTGELLAVMEAPELNAQLDASAARLKSQEAIYIASKANYDRLVETSHTPGTVSQNDLDQASAKTASDQAQLQALKSAYREIADTRGYLEIRAPFSGVISARNVNVGAYVGPAGKGSELPLFTLQEQKKLRLVVSVPELYTGYITNKVNIAFTVGSQPDKKYTAIVKRMAGALDTRLRSERVEMDVVNDNKKLLPGMIAQVILPLPSVDSNFLIPKSALVNSTQGVFVVKVTGDHSVWIPVQSGRSNDQSVEIYGRLTPGDTLALVANDEIRNGAVVKKFYFEK